MPPAIQLEAQRRGIALASIKLQGENWVACEGVGNDAACIVLGRVGTGSRAAANPPAKLTGLTSGTQLEVYQYGQEVRRLGLSQAHPFGRLTSTAAQGVTFEMNPGIEARITVAGRKDQVIDTLPRYRREGTNLVRTKDYKLVRDYIDARPEESFTVIVTVPALCEPCRRLDKLMRDKIQPVPSNTAATVPGRLLNKVFVLEYFSFAEAEREVLGVGAVFPTTMVFGVEAQPRKSISRFIGNLRGSSMDEISRPLSDRFRRGSPHTLSRGVIAQELLFQFGDQRLTRR